MKTAFGIILLLVFYIAANVDAQSSSYPLQILLTNASSGLVVADGDEVTITVGDVTHPPQMPKLMATVKFPTNPILYEPPAISFTLKVKLPTVVYGGKQDNSTSKDVATVVSPVTLGAHDFSKSFTGDLSCFGGEAILTAGGYAPGIIKPFFGKLKFFIVGSNPDTSTCKQYINNLPSVPYFANAIAKVESANPYHQFYDKTSNYPPGASYRMEGFPLLNKINQYPGSDGGYGIFQITNPIPTSIQKWNWQENCKAAVNLMLSKRDIATKYYDDLNLVFPEASNDPVPAFTITASNGNNVSLAPLDIIWIMAYNGFAGCPKRAVPGTSQRIPTCFSYDASAPAGQRWTFHDNEYDYVHKVVDSL